MSSAEGRGAALTLTRSSCARPAARYAGDHPIMEPYHEHWRPAADLVCAAWATRGRKRRALRAAVGHALAFAIWHSRVRRERLDTRLAIGLMGRLVGACCEAREA